MIEIHFNGAAPEDFVDFVVGAGQPDIDVSICIEPAPVEMCWRVTALNAVSGVPNPSRGIAYSFALRPAVADARRGLRAGSYAPNDPVGYTVEVTAEHANRSLETRTACITQDEISIIRQEHVDFGGNPPARAQFSQHAGAFNVGNYRYVVNLAELQNRFNRTVAAYRGRTVLLNGVFPVAIPQTAQVAISSAYRNPRRNVAIGSRYPITSRHVLGRAIDMEPVTPVQVHVARRGVVALGLHTHLYPALLAAAQTVGTALTENGATPVPVGNALENHVHLQW